YHVPTRVEWEAYQNLLTSKNAAGWFASPLKLTYAGDWERTTGWYPAPGTDSGWYWSSSPHLSSSAWHLGFRDIGSSPHNSSDRSWGHSLRCLQD
ncbi:hypothetical protein VQ048_00005, partial [Bergeyella sp. RCAD1439]|nr:hypothetical protein [Bergeyella sp. RCAD1439]